MLSDFKFIQFANASFPFFLSLSLSLSLSQILPSPKVGADSNSFQVPFKYLTHWWRYNPHAITSFYDFKTPNEDVEKKFSDRTLSRMRLWAILTCFRSLLTHPLPLFKLLDLRRPHVHKSSPSTYISFGAWKNFEFTLLLHIHRPWDSEKFPNVKHPEKQDAYRHPHLEGRNPLRCYNT